MDLLSPRLRRFCAAAAAGLAVLVLASGAQAQWVSTGELVDTYCDSEDVEQQAFCVGYIAGSLHVLMAPPELFPRGRFCIDIENQPRLSTIAERLIQVRKDSEDLATVPAYTVIAAILERGFPCPEEVIEELDAEQGGDGGAPNAVPDEVFGLDD